MRDFAAESRAKNKAKRSRQEKIDKIMCRPGYTWNETVKRCLGPLGSATSELKPPSNGGNSQKLPAIPGDAPNSGGAEIAKEAYLRKSQGLSSK